MTSTCYTFPYIALRHYPWPHSLEPRANCISCRQMSYFSLLPELSRQKKTFHFTLPRMIDCPQTSKRQNIGTNNYYEVESFSSFNRLHNLPWFPPPTAEFLLCDGEMHFRVMSVHSLVRWPHFSHSGFLSRFCPHPQRKEHFLSAFLQRQPALRAGSFLLHFVLHD